jgi:hypothetical protein
MVTKSSEKIQAAVKERSPMRSTNRQMDSVHILRHCLFFWCLLLPLGCMPEHMEVRTDIDPRNVDEDVRFRTTYYFRVFDICAGQLSDREQEIGKENGESDFTDIKHGAYILMTDSLYRFRMTGKGSSIFSDIHFESGTLHRSEIDPFGSAIVFDKQLGRHRYVTQRETQDQAGEKADFEAVKTIIKDDFVQLDPQIKESLKMELNDLVKNFLALHTPSKNQQNTGPNQPTQLCPSGATAQRGFQILGPEGWRTFNQDERLIMAMATSGKPVISTMKELSARALNERDAHGEGAALPLLLQEQLRILRATLKLEEMRKALGEQRERGTAEKTEIKADEAVRAIRDIFERHVLPQEVGK